MEHTVVLAVLALVVVAATNLLAERLPIPAAIVQTAIGIVLAFIPGVPAIHLDPDFVLLAVLPLLVYAAAVELPWEDFRDNLRPISALAFGLVAVTVAAVAAVAHALVPGLPWTAALVLGAIVSPTDPVAATALASRIGVPQRLVAIVEGEGLVNDAVALTIKSIAAAALLGGTLSISGGVLKFVAIVAGEIAYGWALGWLIATIRRRIDDSSTEIVISIVTAFAAYLVPVALGGSGVLATVATGMYIGEKNPELVPAGTRLHLTSVWEVIVYGLNGILFVLTGLQFRTIWTASHGSGGNILIAGAAIAAVAIVIRFCWTWPAEWLIQMLPVRRGKRQPRPPARHLTFVAWSGMRGAISLAAALSLPGALEYRSPFIFITACVIAATLLVQGTTLPWLIRLLRLDRDAEVERESERQGEANARGAAAQAAIAALDRENTPVAAHVRKAYEAMMNEGQSDNSDAAATVETGVRRRAIAAARRRIIDLHNSGEIGDRVLRRVERDLDLREALVDHRALSPLQHRPPTPPQDEEQR